MENNYNFFAEHEINEGQNMENITTPDSDYQEETPESQNFPIKATKDKLNIQNDKINFFPNPQYLLENFEIHEEPILEISRDDSNCPSNESYEDTRLLS